MNKRRFEIVSKEEWMKNIPFDVLDETWMSIYNELKLPKRGTAKSAGYDCYSPYGFNLDPKEEIKIPTGIRAFMNDDNVLKAYPRSGHGFKYYLRLANTTGIIDADYVESDNEGHMFVKIRNEGDKSLYINRGDGFCQFLFHEYLLVADDSFEGEKRNGGFGSTDK